MNIHCPNCQRPLTVQDQYAGQMMKCPLCGNTFTVPSLAAPAPPAAPPPAAASPEASAFADTWPPPSEPPPPPPPPQMETYGVSSPPPTPERAERRERPSPPLPSHEPAEFEEPTWEMEPTEPAATPSRGTAPPPPPPAGYTHTFSLSINPRILPWIAPGAMFLIFILTFFNWVGLYPDGYGVYTQNAWQAAFSGGSEDKVWEAKIEPRTEGPGFGWLTFFYLFVFLPTMCVAIASVLVHLKLIPVNLPPALQQYWQWRPLAVGALVLFAFFFLALQVLFGFRLESRIRNDAEAATKSEAEKAKTDDEKREVELRQARYISEHNPGRTFAFRLVVILHLVAIAGLGLEFWMQHRGSRPMPRLDVMW